jgi:hypothetical protein
MKFLPPSLFALLIAPAIPVAAAGWQLIGEGDCSGRQVVGSLGVEPEAERCTPEFAGKTALCFTQVCNPGCQYIDVRTADCRGGTELAQVYTCVQPPATGQALEATGK